MRQNARKKGRDIVQVAITVKVSELLQVAVVYASEAHEKILTNRKKPPIIHAAKMK